MIVLKNLVFYGDKVLRLKNYTYSLYTIFSWISNIKFKLTRKPLLIISTGIRNFHNVYFFKFR